ncbi:hypothetical protein LX36DRAFT_650708 [Colletotrichum falcatum]|nr:hypothetical protein LX36DRAFT_650708 [Colletotrichum falcatum]
MGINDYDMARHPVDSSSQPPSPLPMQPQTNNTHPPTRVTAFSSPHPILRLPLATCPSVSPIPPTLPPRSSGPPQLTPWSLAKFPSLPVTSRQSWTLDASSPAS